MKCTKPDVILLAGGLGTRLREEVPDLPKCMAPVGGKPFLEYLLKYLDNNFLPRVILSLGYLPDAIQQYFGTRFGNIALRYSIEEEPLGTGGGTIQALALTHTDQIIVLNADTLFEIDLDEMLHQHIISKADITIALHEADVASRYGVVVTNASGRITSFTEKKPGTGKGLINGGIYVIRRDYLVSLSLPRSFSLEKDVFRNYVATDRYFGYTGAGYFIDIGVPSDYRRACDELPEIIRL